MSDPQGILASPLTTIQRRNEAVDVDAILNIASQYQVERLILGLPRSLDGSLGKQAEKVKAFAQSLSKQSRLPIEFRDERLSTVSAKRLMHDTKPKRARHDDAIAAALILQTYLDERE
jgi:putative Holliday junction resolvase